MGITWLHRSANTLPATSNTPFSPSVILSWVGNRQKLKDSQHLTSHTTRRDVQNGSRSRDWSVTGQNVFQKRRTVSCSGTFLSCYWGSPHCEELLQLKRSLFEDSGCCQTRAIFHAIDWAPLSLKIAFYTTVMAKWLRERKVSLLQPVTTETCVSWAQRDVTRQRDRNE